MTVLVTALTIFIPYQLIFIILRAMKVPRAEPIDIIVIQTMVFNIIFTSTYYLIG